MKKIIAAVVFLSVTASAFAQQALKPDDAVKYRKAGMAYQSWNMGRIKANVDGSFNKDQVVAAANAIAAIANSGIGELFAPGTDNAALGDKTRLKPEYFQQPDKAKEVAMNYLREANELAKVAASGDAAAVKAQFGKTGGTCKGCHDAFQAK
jgi:cytochrome c556